MSNNTPWMDIALSHMGVKEIPGSRHNPVILEFFNKAGFPNITDDETAWCAAFGNAVLHDAGIPGTNSLLARSFLNWGEKVKTPEYGDIVVMRRGNSSWQGHVFFFERFEGNYVVGIGGNQSNAVTRARYPKSSILGYRRVPAEFRNKPAPKKTVDKKEKNIGPTEVAVGAGGILSSLVAFASSDIGTSIIVLGIFALIFWYLTSRR